MRTVRPTISRTGKRPAHRICLPGPCVINRGYFWDGRAKPGAVTGESLSSCDPHGGGVFCPVGLVEEMMHVAQSDWAPGNMVTIGEPALDQGTGGDDGAGDLIDIVAGSMDYRAADTAIDETFIPRDQLEGPHIADLDGKCFAQVKILNGATEVVRDLCRSTQVVFQIDEGDMVPGRCVNNAVVEVVFIAGRHLRKLK